MSSYQPITEAIKTFLEKNQPEEKKPIHPTEDLFEKGIMDSLQIVATVSFIEEQFKCSLDFDDLEEKNLKTIEAITSLIQRKQGSQN